MSSLFSAVLLAGGKSTRMGRNKAFIRIEGVPLWQRQLQVLEALNPLELFVAGPRHCEWLAKAEILADARTNTGPLGGLVAGLRRCSAPLLVALAVDLPCMTATYLGSLISDSSFERGIVPIAADRWEPLAAVYPKRALASAESLLASGQYSLQDFVERCLAEGLIVEKEIDDKETALFQNVNRPEDFASLTAFERLHPAASGDGAYIG